MVSGENLGKKFTILTFIGYLVSHFKANSISNKMSTAKQSFAEWTFD